MMHGEDNVLGTTCTHTKKQHTSHTAPLAGSLRPTSTGWERSSPPPVPVKI
jgi:hypothetical protein